MYDMYPEWGPAKNRRDDEHHNGVQASFDRSDDDRRPDDN